MSDILSKLAESKHIKEWVDPDGEHMFIALERARERGGLGRHEILTQIMPWSEAGVERKEEHEQLMSLIGGLLVNEPSAVDGAVVVVPTGFNRSLSITFTKGDDWLTCLPHEEFALEEKHEGRQAWSATAITDNGIGLEVWAEEAIPIAVSQSGRVAVALDVELVNPKIMAEFE